MMIAECQPEFGVEGQQQERSTIAGDDAVLKHHRNPRQVTGEGTPSCRPSCGTPDVTPACDQATGCPARATARPAGHQKVMMPRTHIGAPSTRRLPSPMTR